MEPALETPAPSGPPRHVASGATSPATRLGVALVALLAAGWIGVLLHDQRRGEAADDTLFYTARITPARFDAELQRLHGAQLLNPDQRWRVLEATYLLTHDRAAESATVARQVVRREPDNFDGWVALVRAAPPPDPRGIRAELMLHRLNPLGVAKPPRR